MFSHMWIFLDLCAHVVLCAHVAGCAGVHLDVCLFCLGTNGKRCQGHGLQW